MNTLSRSTALKIAAVISFVVSAANFAFAVSFVARGAAASNASNNPPFAIGMLYLITSVIGMAAAYGVWKGQTWGVVLTIVANVFNILVAAPGMVLAPTPLGHATSVANTIASVAIIVLCLWRERKAALA